MLGSFGGVSIREVKDTGSEDSWNLGLSSVPSSCVTLGQLLNTLCLHFLICKNGMILVRKGLDELMLTKCLE